MKPKGKVFIMEGQYTWEKLMKLSMSQLKEIALKEAKKRNFIMADIHMIERMEQLEIKYNVMEMILEPTWTSEDFATDVLLD